MSAHDVFFVQSRSDHFTMSRPVARTEAAVGGRYPRPGLSPDATDRILLEWANPSGRVKMKKLTCHQLALLLLLFHFSGTGWGQVTASVTGVVRDASGAVVPGAAVTVQHVETGTRRTAQTDEDGNYSVPSLPVGQYELDVEKAAFKQQVRSGITLAVGQQAVVNITLEVGDVEQLVNVTAEAPMVNTTLSSTSGLVSEREVKELPLNGRSFDQLLTLNTGTANVSSNRNTNQPGNLFSVSGRRPEENRFLMNGVDYVSASGGINAASPNGSNGQVLGVDAVREFNVVEHTYGAEWGKRAGAQVSIVTTSGTNQVHGDVFEYLRNSVLDARNFFDRPIGLRIPPFKRNQFGVALGWPLKRDKLSLYGNYEGFRQRLAVSSDTIVPCSAARLGLLPNGSVVPNLRAAMLPYSNAFWPVPTSPDTPDAPRHM